MFLKMVTAAVFLQDNQYWGGGGLQVEICLQMLECFYQRQVGEAAGALA